MICTYKKHTNFYKTYKTPCDDFTIKKYEIFIYCYCQKINSYKKEETTYEF